MLRGLGLTATSANDVCAVLKTELRKGDGQLYKAYFDKLQEKGLGVGAFAHGPDPTISGSSSLAAAVRRTRGSFPFPGDASSGDPGPSGPRSDSTIDAQDAILKDDSPPLLVTVPLFPDVYESMF